MVVVLSEMQVLPSGSHSLHLIVPRQAFATFPGPFGNSMSNSFSDFDLPRTFIR